MTTTARPMTPELMPSGSTTDLLPTLQLHREGSVVVVVLARETKHNALDDATIQALGALFSAPPTWARAAVVCADGRHFSAGLDLSEMADRSTVQGMEHSMMWHRAFDAIESGRIPVVAALHGAVIGGGLELALATHIRVADESAFYALPEGQHGLFVGGGASVRLPRVIGTHRMSDMMLTGRRLDAHEGQHAGISSYLVPTGESRSKAIELATKVARNADLTNFAVLHALPGIADASPAQGYLMESMMAAIASGSDEAKRRMADFVEGRRADRSAEGEQHA